MSIVTSKQSDQLLADYLGRLFDVKKWYYDQVDLLHRTGECIVDGTDLKIFTSGTPGNEVHMSQLLSPFVVPVFPSSVNAFLVDRIFRHKFDGVGDPILPSICNEPRQIIDREGYAPESGCG